MLVIFLQPVIIFYLSVYSVTIRCFCFFKSCNFLSNFQIIKNSKIYPVDVIDLYFIVLRFILYSLQVWEIDWN
jgi:hypothetical protein